LLPLSEQFFTKCKIKRTAEIGDHICQSYHKDKCGFVFFWDTMYMIFCCCEWYYSGMAYLVVQINCACGQICRFWSAVDNTFSEKKLSVNVEYKM